MKRLMVLMMLLAMVIVIGPKAVKADDLDDGISKYNDDSIAADDELGKPDKNIKFIIENAKSQAKVSEKKAGKGTTKTGKTSGDSNENSVVMGAGSNVHGDIIIIAPDAK